MKPPCMIVVQYVLPAIRVLVMKNLIQEHDMRKIDAAKRMELTPAAITQYMKGERGEAFADQITRSEKTMKIISELADSLARGGTPTEDMIDKLCEACSTIRNERIICGLHKEKLPSLKESRCAIC